MKLILHFFLLLLFVFPSTLLAKCIEGNCQNGVGTYNYHIGKVYKGEWKNGNKHGQGIYTYPDGKKYIGGFQDGKKHGYGIETYPDGSKYDGDFRYGKPNGQGTFTGSDGKQVIIGEFKNGKTVGTNVAATKQENPKIVQKEDATSIGKATTSDPDHTSLGDQFSPSAVSVTGITVVRDIDSNKNVEAPTAGGTSVASDAGIRPDDASDSVQAVAESVDANCAQVDVAAEPEKIQETVADSDRLQIKSRHSLLSTFETREQKKQTLSAGDAASVGKEKDRGREKVAAASATVIKPHVAAENMKPAETPIDSDDHVQAADRNQKAMNLGTLAAFNGPVTQRMDTEEAEKEPTVYTLTIDETINVQQTQTPAEDQAEQANRENAEQSDPDKTAAADNMIESPGESNRDRFEYREVLTIPDMHNPEEVEQNRIPDGQGTKIFPDGSTYVGEFKNGMPNGQGGVTTLFGKKYLGEFVNGFPHGQGIFTSPDGEQYVGEFRFGVPHGQGIYIYTDGEQYTGDLKNGIKSGQGVSTFSDGSKYLGDWKDGEFYGSGTYTNAEGLKYTGEWKNGRQHGHGTLIHPDGEKYTGEFKKGKPDGFGTLTYANGKQFTGEFRKGEPVQ